MKKIKNKINKIISIAVAKKPEKVLVLVIFFLNILLVFGASAVLVILYPRLEGGSFWKTAFNVVTMILDAGCIQSIVDGETYPNSAFLPILCIVIIFIGTLIFTGAIIGYLSNRISNFITDANRGSHRLFISDHIVIINWNNRASEIINDLLFSDEKEKVVVLVGEKKDQIEREIKNQIADTIEREKARLNKEAQKLIDNGKISKKEKKRYIRENYQIKRTTVIVREGEVFSLKQLNDISVEKAKNVIILSKNNSDDICKYNNDEMIKKIEKGNIETIKSLVQISEITSDINSANDQKVVVEVEDDWTMGLVKMIIQHKEKLGKCNIVAVPINKILGQILSQFSVMPELNSVYSELFSNKGSTFYSRSFPENENESAYIQQYMNNHTHAIPLTTMNTRLGRELFFIAGKSRDFEVKSSKDSELIPLKINKNFKFENKHIAIIGHNSKSIDILKGFSAFLDEWGLGNNASSVEIMIIDDKKHLEKVNYYKDYIGENGQFPFIKKIVCADIYDGKTIQKELNEYIDSHNEDTSVLILSDDYVPETDIDSNALTYLVYLQDIVYKRSKNDPDFNPESIDIIIELLNPKNYDVVKSYSINNVIISNRYISRMIVQIGDKESIYDFYKDILTYDSMKEIESAFESKELYVKFAKTFFEEGTQFPIESSPRNITASVYHNSPEDNKTVVIGVVKDNSKNKIDKKSTIIIFTDNADKKVKINENDKLILFAPH